MRNKVLFLIGIMFLLIHSTNSMAQKIIADWDNIEPIDFSVWAGTYEAGATNPDQSGINSSSKVLKWQRGAGNLYQAVDLRFESSKLITKPILSTMVYWPNVGQINIALIDDNNNQVAELDKTVSVANSWIEIEFDFSDYLLASNNYYRLYIYADKGVDNNLTYYFDNLKFKNGFDNMSDAVIARERFNGAPNPWEEYLGPTGNVNTWTANNGTITNDSIQILIYTKPDWDGPYVYPEPSQGAFVRLGGQSATAFLKTDTLIMSEIDAKGFKDFRVSFTSAGHYNTETPNVQIKADDGAWQSLSYTNNNTEINKMLQYEIPTGISTANKLEIKFACLYTWGGIWIDDIGIIGTAIPVESLNVNTNSDSTYVLMGNKLQFNCSVSPSNAYDTSYAWSVVGGTGSATIDATGKLTPVSAGTVTVKAKANDGSGVTAEKNVVIYNTISGITVSGTDGVSAITSNDGTLQLLATVLPETAKQEVKWELIQPQDTDTALLSSDGLLTALRNGIIDVKATATDGSDISGVLSVALSNQIVEPETLVISNVAVNTNDQKIQLTIESSTPIDADKSVIWNIISENDEDTATITAEGLLTPLRNGNITVKAVSTVDASISTTKNISITGQVVEATAVTITSSNIIPNLGDELELTATVIPDDAEDKSVSWSILYNDDGAASLTGSTLTSFRYGKVTVKAALDADATVFDEMEITISGQSSALESIAIIGNDITTNAGTSQMIAALSPADAENVEIAWALSSASDSAKATISSTGLITAFANGSITVVANDKNSDIQSTKTLAISGQVVVDSLALSTAGDAVTISENGGSLKVSAEVLPADARIKDIVWSVVAAGGSASVDQTGLVKAQADGVVYVKATAQDAGAHADSIKITISGQVLIQSVDILVTADTIKKDDGSLILPINVSPDNAADTTVTWSIVSDTANAASIDATSGLITAIRNGGIKVMAVANANASLKDSAIVVIENQKVAPTAITLMGADSAKTITVNNGELQMSAIVTPKDAIADVEWGIAGDKHEIATVDVNGLVTAFRDGVVFVQATSTLARTVSGRYEITITNQVVEPTELEIVSQTGKDSILVNNGTLSLLAKVTPDDAVADVTWSIDASDADTASISESGILTAIRNGKVIVKAVSNVADAVMDTFVVNIVNQVVEPTAISIVGTDSVSTIDVDNGTLALLINTTPADAVKDVCWSMAASDADKASIDSLGVVTAKLNGVATVMAMSVVDSAVVDTFDVTITNQVEDVVSPDSILVKGEGGATEITTSEGILQMIAEVYPVESDSTVVWSIEIADTALATISETGLLTAKADGSVTVIATSAIVDTIQGMAEIEISGQVTDILVASIEVSAADDATGIDVKGGTLQLTATLSPDDATNKEVEWSVDKTELASISVKGLVTAIADGEVVVTAKAKEGSEVSGSITLTISNQTVGIADGLTQGFKVYPNPVEDILFVSNVESAICIEIVDVKGKILFSEKNEFEGGFSINTANLNKGIYIVRISTKDQVFGFKLVK